jgi:hypothetical protein
MGSVNAMNQVVACSFLSNEFLWNYLLNRFFIGQAG